MIALVSPHNANIFAQFPRILDWCRALSYYTDIPRWIQLIIDTPGARPAWSAVFYFSIGEVLFIGWFTEILLIFIFSWAYNAFHVRARSSRMSSVCVDFGDYGCQWRVPQCRSLAIFLLQRRQALRYDAFALSFTFWCIIGRMALMNTILIYVMTHWPLYHIFIFLATRAFAIMSPKPHISQRRLHVRLTRVIAFAFIEYNIKDFSWVARSLWLLILPYFLRAILFSFNYFLTYFHIISTP